MEKIWLKSYPKSVPLTIDPNRYSSLVNLLQDSVERYPANTALENFGTRLSYRDTWRKSLRLAAYLQKELHLQKGDRLAIMLPNVMQYPIVLLAALQIGCVIVNINPLYTERELLLPLQDSGAKTIVVLANFTSHLQKVLPETSLKHVIVTEMGDEFPFLKRILVNTYIKYFKKLTPKIDYTQFISYRDIFAGKKMILDPVMISADDLAFLQYTGGTTGVAKGAMLTHRNMVSNVLQSIAWIEEVLQEGAEMVVTALPLYHIFSLTVCFFVFWKIGAHSLLITNPRDIKGFIKTLRKKSFSVFVGVNTLFHELMRHRLFSTLHFQTLKLCVAGGMPVTKTVADQWQASTGNNILMGYGLTECSPVVAINPLTSKSFTGSIGLPVPSTEIKLIDEQGEEVPLGSSGELWVSGPQVMKGYWQQPQETNQALTDGWLHTGDIAKMDGSGYLYLIDRKKDMILVSGFNVYPLEVETVIASHPGVAEVAVIGIPNDQSGEAVKAVIVKKDKTLTEQEIMTFCKTRLTGYKQPKVIIFSDALPKSSVGKILKPLLRNNA